MASRRDDFKRWVHAVDSLLMRSYCITIEDAGLSLEDLRRHYSQEPDAREFVRWFARKFDLTGRREWIGCGI
jgi:hypothetical protein